MAFIRELFDVYCKLLPDWLTGNSFIVYSDESKINASEPVSSTSTLNQLVLIQPRSSQQMSAAMSPPVDLSTLSGPVLPRPGAVPAQAILGSAASILSLRLYCGQVKTCGPVRAVEVVLPLKE
ncbi:unnamed protein product [Arctogadus glacialis]